MKSNKESEIPDGRSAQREVSVSESRNEQKAKALRMTGLSAKEFQDSGFSVARNEAQPNAVRQGENLSKRNKNEVFMKRSSKIRAARKIQDSGFSVACNKVKCANVTTLRNERNFLKKFLKWSYQVVTARKIQESGFSVAQSEARSSSVYQEQKLIS